MKRLKISVKKKKKIICLKKNVNILKMIKFENYKK